MSFPYDDFSGTQSLHFFEQIVGRDAAIKFLGTLLGDAKTSVDSILTHVPSQQEFDQARMTDLETANRDLRTRSLYPMAAMSKPYVIRELNEHPDKTESRFYKGQATRTLIIDNKVVALVANQPSSPLKLLVTETPGVVQGFAAMFENIWQRATPLVPGKEDALVLPPRAEAVLTRIIQGQTEKEIATALHVSTKTVQREVEYLMDYFQKTSRNSMIAEAGRRGYTG